MLLHGRCIQCSCLASTRTAPAAMSQHESALKTRQPPHTQRPAQSATGRRCWGSPPNKYSVGTNICFNQAALFTHTEWAARAPAARRLDQLPRQQFGHAGTINKQGYVHIGSQRRHSLGAASARCGNQGDVRGALSDRHVALFKLARRKLTTHGAPARPCARVPSSIKEHGRSALAGEHHTQTNGA